MVDGHPNRCVRGGHCDALETVVDDEGQRFRLPADTDPDRALCPTCIRHLRYALAALPLDVADLTVAFAPSSQVKYRDPGMPAPSRVKKHPPLPFDGNAEALRALIDHEATSWAESVADEAGLTTDSWRVRRSRVGWRVQMACEFLASHLDHLMTMPATTHRARSTGENRVDGQDPDTVTFDGHDVWITRDGTQAALVFLELHRQVERFVGRAASDRCPVPCPVCQRQALHREHPRTVVAGSLRVGTPGQVVCRCCWHSMSDDDYAALTDITSALFGVTP